MSDTPRFSRRSLVGGTAASLGLVGLGVAGATGAQAYQASRAEATGWGTRASRPFYGAHQNGIEVPPTSHARYLTFDLVAGVDRGAIRRMLRIITEDAVALGEGRVPLADSEPELAVIPANLMVTLGFGEKLVRLAGGDRAVPSWLAPVPDLPIDKLDPRYTGGDLLMIIQADDLLTVSHAARVLTRQTVSFLSLRWSQDGFRRAMGSAPQGSSMRNLFGQVDGTRTPHPGEDQFNRYVWGESRTHGNPTWLAGGTGYVLRRITMDLDTWDEVDRPDRERSVGRTLDTGAPLTGATEQDPPDFDARDELGLPVIPDFAHMRRARATNSDEIFARRGYNFERPASDGPGEAGLLFEVFAIDPVAQYLPVQRRLAELDMLNLWTTPTGSAVYALPPGCEPGGYIGDTLV